MAIPAISLFIPFHKLDPSKKNQCIFPTQKGERCRWCCEENDNASAIWHQETIRTQIMLGQLISLDLLQMYILCNCSKEDNAKHQHRIEDIGFSMPLAQRWNTEIMRYDAYQSQTKTSLPAPSEESLTQAPVSEFRLHIATPGPNDSVARNILDPLQNYDFQTGSVYAFDRESSPGHVKIGWTAVSIAGRLEHWANCGYKPNLIISVHNIPCAQRVETLIHYELIREWRRERSCIGCRKSHKEWFEVDPETAKQVVVDWANFMKISEPYTPEGLLNDMWLKIVKDMEARDQVVTARKLLDHFAADFAALLLEELTLIEDQIDSTRPSQVDEKIIDSLERTLVHDDFLEAKSSQFPSSANFTNRTSQKGLMPKQILLPSSPVQFQDS
ncbi:T5orf172 domain-containing protein [Talaromyces proteolyticus]|uniref:T5orf172 domain-containing protein n=1 Tax=Talaromyces proteolyticus TaxID=1131652 RepID=A0AAD4L077_9EURO|nr:T5orf172 domain-containing protein [Talaromyces proteolyticus]KAH8703336.1 T5orf172 domain-containing protein [Talaromyces proteolyticus]